MDILTSILVGIGLSMDCLGISVCISSINKITLKDYIRIPLYFSISHFIMIFAGLYSGNYFHKYIVVVDHWIAFFLLFSIGVKIIYDSLKKDDIIPDMTSHIKLIMFSFATSLDAMAVGFAFSLINGSLMVPAIIISIIVMIITLIGLRLGKNIGNLEVNYAGIFGGLILIVISLKILLTHLF
ncbi:MAG: manganese efflux pump MntP family protein [DPANN group archaeon]|nr:manganese efflux pump MntP family protein [DPANN group archaeon]